MATKPEKARRIADILRVDIPVACMIIDAVQAGDVEKVIYLLGMYCSSSKQKSDSVLRLARSRNPGKKEVKEKWRTVYPANISRLNAG